MRLYRENPGPPATTASGATILTITPRSSAGPESPAPWAHRWTGNLLELTPATIEQMGGGRLIVNSGTLGDDLDALDPHNWMTGGIRALIGHLESLNPALRAANARLLIEPCSRHILHDAPVAKGFFREHSENPIGLALNPTALFEPTMLPFCEDHLQRIAESLAPIAAALILTDARLDADGERLVPCDLGNGAFDLDGAARACLSLLAPDAPIIIRRADKTSLSASILESIRARATSLPPV